MSYTLRYSSSRAEIWQWYWRTWKKSMWRIHVALAVLVGFILSGSNIDTAHVWSWLMNSLLSLPIVVTIFAVFPQIKFKNQERTLHVGADGWTTKIGKISGSRTWSEVDAVNDEAGSVVIRGTNGNALIVPARAFASNEQRQQFINDIREWRGKVS